MESCFWKWSLQPQQRNGSDCSKTFNRYTNVAPLSSSGAARGCFLKSCTPALLLKMDPAEQKGSLWLAVPIVVAVISSFVLFLHDTMLFQHLLRSLQASESLRWRQCMMKWRAFFCLTKAKKKKNKYQTHMIIPSAEEASRVETKKETEFASDTWYSETT